MTSWILPVTKTQGGGYAIFMHHPSILRISCNRLACRPPFSLRGAHCLTNWHAGRGALILGRYWVSLPGLPPKIVKWYQ